MTFSVVALCPTTGQLGVAISTAIPAVGAYCPWAAPHAGAVTTQSWVNPYLGIRALDRLRAGDTAEAALEEVLSQDPDSARRQVGIVDRDGGSAAFTGEECTGWAGHATGSGWAVQGNMLVGEATVRAMAETIDGPGALWTRLVSTLQAGQEAGGDMRGRQSAALLVVEAEDYPLLDLRVDEHANPVAELARLLPIAEQQVMPFARSMPHADGTMPPRDTTLEQRLLQPPHQR